MQELRFGQYIFDVPTKLDVVLSSSYTRLGYDIKTIWIASIKVRRIEMVWNWGTAVKSHRNNVTVSVSSCTDSSVCCTLTQRGVDICLRVMRERQTDRGRERQRERERDKEKDREREMERETERETERESDRETERERDRWRERQRDR